MQKLLTSLAGTAAAAVLLAGCAQVPPNAGENPSDPYERVNRNIYAFNDSIDRAVFRPVAETYVEWTPEWVRTRVSNVVDNLGDPGNAVNNTLQGKVDRGIESLMRFLVNSTFGIAGIFDVADEIGLKRHSEDFGQTLGVWGVGSGSYLVLPILGPSSTRDWTMDRRLSMITIILRHSISLTTTLQKMNRIHSILQRIYFFVRRHLQFRYMRWKKESFL